VTKVTRAFALLAVAIMALSGGYFVHLWLLEPESANDPASVLLAASLPDLAGRQQPLTQWQGKVIIVNFWATWCPPCLREIPEFVRVQERLGARGVQFVGIAIDDHAKVAAFVASHAINYPVLMAESEGIALARAAGNRLGGLPFTVIIDRQGRTAKVELGTLDEKKLIPLLTPLL
jgi:thiol-disulfide isomerase/thioredoxin